MVMETVSSSLVAALGFEADAEDPRTGTVRVWFNGGATFDYDGVSRDDFEDLRDSPSVGKAWHAWFKKRYTGRRV